MIANIKKTFDCDKETLWNMVTDLTDWSWRSDIKRIEVINDKHFIEYTNKEFATYFEIIEKTFCQVYRFQLQNSHMTGQWKGYFEELSDGAVQLDFTEEITVTHAWMRPFAKLYLKKQQRQYMLDLTQAVMKIKNR